MPDSDRFGADRVTDIYRRGTLRDDPPDFPVSYPALREAAHEAMADEAVALVHGGAGSEAIFEREQDCSAWRIVLRMLPGAAGVETYLQNLLAEFDLTMGPSGRARVDAIDRDAVRHESDLP